MNATILLTEGPNSCRQGRVIGLGHVGLPPAVEFAKGLHAVIDVQPSMVDELNAGISIFNTSPTISFGKRF